MIDLLINDGLIDTHDYYSLECSINTYLLSGTQHMESSFFMSSNRILPFAYTFSGIFVELQKVIQSARMCE